MSKLTPELVEQRLAAAFRTLPGHPVFSSGREIRALEGGRQGDLDVISAASRLLADRRAERLALFTWARAKGGGPTVSDFCREFHLSRAGFEKRRRRAARIVADGMNTVNRLDE